MENGNRATESGSSRGTLCKHRDSPYTVYRTSMIVTVGTILATLIPENNTGKVHESIGACAPAPEATLRNISE